MNSHGCGLNATWSTSFLRLYSIHVSMTSLVKTPPSSRNAWSASSASSDSASEPVDKDIYELEGEEKAKIKSVPGSLAESLDALEKDHAFLLEGGVFTKDVIDTWIEYKRKKEVDAVALRPHPWEFMLYSDV